MGLGPGVYVLERQPDAGSHFKREPEECAVRRHHGPVGEHPAASLLEEVDAPDRLLPDEVPERDLFLSAPPDIHTGSRAVSLGEGPRDRVS